MRCEDFGERTVVTLDGYHMAWDPPERVSETRRKLEAMVPGIRTLELDMAAVGMVGADGLSMLITLHLKLRRKGGDLVLHNVATRIREVMDACKIKPMFRFAGEELEADPCVVVNR